MATAKHSKTNRGPKLKLVTWLPVRGMMLWHGWTERYARTILAGGAPDLPVWMWEMVWCGLMDEANGNFTAEAWLNDVREIIVRRRSRNLPADFAEDADLSELAVDLD